jgi:putative MFS transporter
MRTTSEVTPASLITARLDRLPMTRSVWTLVLLIALGGTFEVYDLFFTGYVAPGLFAEKILTPTTTSLFGMTGLASFIFALFTGLFIGTIAFAFVADKFGRRAIFTYSLLWYSACTLILAFQDTANGINLWRMISGIGIGVELVTIDTYISELVPKSARGKAFAFQQGIGFLSVPLVALFAWLLVPLSPLGLSGWRWVVIIGSLGAIVIWIIRWRLPESPRWLAQHGRLADAERVIAAIEARVEADTASPCRRRPRRPPSNPAMAATSKPLRPNTSAAHS